MMANQAEGPAAVEKPTHLFSPPPDATARLSDLQIHSILTPCLSHRSNSSCKQLLPFAASSMRSFPGSCTYQRKKSAVVGLKMSWTRFWAPPRTVPQFVVPAPSSFTSRAV